MAEPLCAGAGRWVLLLVMGFIILFNAGDTCVDVYASMYWKGERK